MVLEYYQMVSLGKPFAGSARYSAGLSLGSFLGFGREARLKKSVSWGGAFLVPGNHILVFSIVLVSALILDFI